MLLSHGSQAVQTSRFSAASVQMNTCEMWYIERFWKCSCNFVISTVKYTRMCIRHGVHTSVSVFDKYLHWPHVNIKKYTCQLCKCKKFGSISVNDLHLHRIYTPYIWPLTLTGTNTPRTGSTF
jgi:hypothetical protein